LGKSARYAGISREWAIQDSNLGPLPYQASITDDQGGPICLLTLAFRPFGVTCRESGDSRRFTAIRAAGSALLPVCAVLAIAAPAAAEDHGIRVAGWSIAELASRLEPVACPGDAPVQVVTVIDQAGVRASVLAADERALVAQSLQLRVAWGTPCVQFGPGGWPVYLQDGGWALHYAPHSGVIPFQPASGCTSDLPTPCALVSPAAGTWTVQLSHEVVEMLVDPDLTGDEVCDPVEEDAYRLDGVWVSDFVTPAWFTGGGGPFDQMRLVGRPGGQG
jgi:hypothetical protein